ncbi:helix-turn-helix domain-containing protein [Nocardia tengchongensis]|uniref:Helix-turn-helix domain-containing protein n=1 Tax=Nocardia tengchongensis TaxID=2055889 RepID=A0ABX8CY99_9NOCA|nr:helix-turn-helix transcriptional regulator [Nocardia tengchongensis]QVI23799.1 helix-turn-helix domain-containing protein [Nocardia tengchongensis]
MARKQIGMQLREARQQANLDLKDVADAMGPGWSTSKVGRIERGESGRISLPEVDALAKILEMDADTHSNVIALIKQAASKSWWYKYRDVIQGGFRIYADMEACALRFDHVPQQHRARTPPDRRVRTSIGPHLLRQ